jgi:hypothetical protein
MNVKYIRVVYKVRTIEPEGLVDFFLRKGLVDLFTFFCLIRRKARWCLFVFD